MKGKGILIAIVGVLIIGALVYYFAVIRKKGAETGDNGEGGKSGNLNDTPPPPTLPLTEEPTLTTENAVEISPKLDWVKQKAVAEYLTTILQPSAQDDLKNWVTNIEKMHAKDPTKWAENESGLKGQVSFIGHALYQMDVWNNDILTNLKAKQ
jgi:hypothetical protein